MRQKLFNCALVIASALCLAGCVEHAASTPEQANVKYFVKKFSTFIYSICIEGHEYIVFDAKNNGNIIHSLSCPCKKEAKK